MYYAYGNEHPQRVTGGKSDEKDDEGAIAYQYIPPSRAAPQPSRSLYHHPVACPHVHHHVHHPNYVHPHYAHAHHAYPHGHHYHYPAPVVEAPKPVGPVPWYGATKAEVDVQNIAIAKQIGATKPTQMVPYGQSDSQQFWCRELDGSYTLRTTNDIMDNLQPGTWQYSVSGYPYFIREKKKD